MRKKQLSARWKSKNIPKGRNAFEDCSFCKRWDIYPDSNKCDGKCDVISDARKCSLACGFVRLPPLNPHEKRLDQKYEASCMRKLIGIVQNGIQQWHPCRVNQAKDFPENQQQSSAENELFPSVVSLNKRRCLLLASCHWHIKKVGFIYSDSTKTPPALQAPRLCL